MLFLDEQSFQEMAKGGKTSCKHREMLRSNRQSQRLEDRGHSAFGDIFLFDVRLDTRQVRNLRIHRNIVILQGCEELCGFLFHRGHGNLALKLDYDKQGIEGGGGCGVEEELERVQGYYYYCQENGNECPVEGQL